MCVGELKKKWRELEEVGKVRRVGRKLRKWKKKWVGLTELDAGGRGGVGREKEGDVAQMWQLGLGN